MKQKKKSGLSLNQYADILIIVILLIAYWFIDFSSDASFFIATLLFLGVLKLIFIKWDFDSIEETIRTKYKPRS